MAGVLLTVINPNTTATMTAALGEAAQAVASAGTRVRAVNPATGPAAIESHVDAAAAVPGVLTEISRASDSDGYVLACFGDPGLDACREVARGPVVGIAEAAMHTATLLGRTFAVVTTLERTVGRARELVGRYGFERACSEVRATGIGVLELETEASARARVTAECADVVAAGADVVVLGCAGMADFAAEVSRAVGVPVVDGVAAATIMVEGLVRQGLSTSRRSEYSHPR